MLYLLRLVSDAYWSNSMLDTFIKSLLKWPDTKRKKIFTNTILFFFFFFFWCVWDFFLFAKTKSLVAQVSKEDLKILTFSQPPVKKFDDKTVPPNLAHVENTETFAYKGRLFTVRFSFCSYSCPTALFGSSPRACCSLPPLKQTFMGFHATYILPPSLVFPCSLSFICLLLS